MTFRQSHEHLKLAEKGGIETTQKATQKILEAIEGNPRITKKELASVISISENGIKFHINSLRNKCLLKRVGPDAGGYWRFLVNKKKKTKERVTSLSKYGCHYGCRLGCHFPKKKGKLIF